MVENAGLENSRQNLQGVEKAGQACMEREMTKNRNFSLIDNPV